MSRNDLWIHAFLSGIAVFAVLALLWIAQTKHVPPSTVSTQPATFTEEQPPLLPILDVPLDRARERMTKKPFGVRVAPANSPVQPERFRGYHTGVDFELLPGESDEVAVRAVCEGGIRVKRWVSGYGGVLVQACTIEGQETTVVYGHLRLSSISFQVGDRLQEGQSFAVLGTGYSSETDGERPHLHLGIHRGSEVDLAGYVAQQAQLASWIDWSVLQQRP